MTGAPGVDGGCICPGITGPICASTSALGLNSPTSTISIKMYGKNFFIYCLLFSFLLFALKTLQLQYLYLFYWGTALRGEFIGTVIKVIRPTPLLEAMTKSVPDMATLICCPPGAIAIAVILPPGLRKKYPLVPASPS